MLPLILVRKHKITKRNQEATFMKSQLEICDVSSNYFATQGMNFHILSLVHPRFFLLRKVMAPPSSWLCDWHSLAPTDLLLSPLPCMNHPDLFSCTV